MTLSKGSAQYALSFYAKRDAYPYGRFRLATVFPGPGSEPAARSGRRSVPRLGQLLAAAPDQGPAGLVSRLLHGRGRRSARGSDRRVGAAEVVPELHRGIRRPARPHGAPQSRGARVDLPRDGAAAPADDHATRGAADNVVVKGEGFRFNSRVRVYYHRVPRGWFPTDANGSFSATFRYPFRVSRQLLDGRDRQGRQRRLGDRARPGPGGSRQSAPAKRTTPNDRPGTPGAKNKATAATSNCR